jgi:hypothetical protein
MKIMKEALKESLTVDKYRMVAKDCRFSTTKHVAKLKIAAFWRGDSAFKTVTLHQLQAIHPLVNGAENSGSFIYIFLEIFLRKSIKVSFELCISRRLIQTEIEFTKNNS